VISSGPESNPNTAKTKPNKINTRLKQQEIKGYSKYGNTNTT
jgi:hypothetical protein